MEFKKGDKVLVTRKASKGEQGWNDVWEPNMDKSVGKILTVEKHGHYGVRLSDDYNYPPHVLQHVGKSVEELEIF